MKPKKMEKIAYHEAGHAVLYYLMRKKFPYVTIEKTPNNEFAECDLAKNIVHNIWNKYLKQCDLDKSDDKTKKHVREEIMKGIAIYIAGTCAKNIYLDDINNRISDINLDSEDEIEDLYKLAMICTDKNKELAQKLISKIEIFIYELLKINWTAVEALVKELLKGKSKIGYLEARKIIKEALEG